MPQMPIGRRTALALMGAAGYGFHARPGGLTGGGQETLMSILEGRDFRGRIAAADVERLQKTEGRTVEQIMSDLIPVARTFSRPPISDFHVGAVVRSTNGDLFVGANIEIPGQVLGCSVHAEQAASSQAYMSGAAGIDAVAVGGAPCGHCRQFLNEMAPDGSIRVLVPGREPMPLGSLLPFAFGPSALGFNRGALPVQSVNIALKGTEDDPLTSAALSAACRSYAPYSKAHSGAAVRLTDGDVHSGAYIENVAFNPSLSPLQVALVSVLLSRHELNRIEDVVLVELDGAVISQVSMTEAVVRSVCPKGRLRRVVAHMDLSGGVSQGAVK